MKVLEKTELTLANLPIGKLAKILRVRDGGLISRRLMEMGVIPGVSVRVVKTAPFGDPMEIRVKNCHLALRRAEAESILVVTED